MKMLILYYFDNIYIKSQQIGYVTWYFKIILTLTKLSYCTTDQTDVDYDHRSIYEEITFVIELAMRNK